MSVLKKHESGGDMRDVREWYLNQKGSRKIDPAVLAQIENGVPAKQYLLEGTLIMQDVFKLLEQLKQGNYNNYIGENAHGSPNSIGDKGEIHTKRTSQEGDRPKDMIPHDAMSLVSKSAISQTVKAKRILQIRRLEKEL